MIVVTGGLGFIGKNLAYKLSNINNQKKICIVDKKKKIKSKKFIYYNNIEFLHNLRFDKFSKKIEFIFHQGANSNTAEKNFQSIMNDNYFYTVELIDICIKHKIPLVYASSASVYGIDTMNFKENSIMKPVNYYSISKSLIDIYALDKIEQNRSIKLAGLRYFNVYGKGEERKKRMASVFHHFTNQLENEGKIKLFKGTRGFKNGEQKRDFVNILDCVDVNLFFLKKFKSGIYNVGSGTPTTFNKVAKNIFKINKKKNKISYINMPKDILDSYQNYTKANISKLRKIGFRKKMISVNEGVKNYILK